MPKMVQFTFHICKKCSTKTIVDGRATPQLKVILLLELRVYSVTAGRGVTKHAHIARSQSTHALVKSTRED
jgi:hypothetical protein